MEYVLDEKTAGKFAEYARNVWDIREDDDMTAAKEGIKCTKEFFKSMNLPQTLTDVGIDEEHFDIMAEKAAASCKRAYRPLSKDDIKTIFKEAL